MITIKDKDGKDITPSGINTATNELPPKNQPEPAKASPAVNTQAPPVGEQRPAPTPEELEAARNQFSLKQFGTTIPKKKDKPAAAPEKKNEPAIPAATEKPAEVAKEEKDKPKSKENDVEEEEESTTKPPAKDLYVPEPNVVPQGTMTQPDSQPVAGLNRAQQRIMKDLTELERMNPDNYRGISKRYASFFELENARIKQWEKDHPGEEYDEQAEEHAGFYEKNEPEVDKEDLEDAKESRIARSAETKALTSTTAQTKLSEVKQQMKEAAEPISREASGDLIAMVKKACPEVLEALKNGGEKKALEEFEMEMEVLNDIGEEVKAVTSELRYLVRFPNHYQTDYGLKRKLKSGQVIHPHSIIVDFGIELEKDLSALPVEKSIRDGKKFITQKGYNERLDSIRNSDITEVQKSSAIRDLNAKYWMMDAEFLRSSFIADRAERAQELINKNRSWIEKRSKKSGSAAAKAEPEKNGEADKKPEDTGKERPSANPPSTASASDRTNPSGGGNNHLTDRKAVIANKMWGV